jgi:hypothetical protein
MNNSTLNIISKSDFIKSFRKKFPHFTGFWQGDILRKDAVEAGNVECIGEMFGITDNKFSDILLNIWFDKETLFDDITPYSEFERFEEDIRDFITLEAEENESLLELDFFQKKARYVKSKYEEFKNLDKRINLDYAEELILPVHLDIPNLGRFYDAILVYFAEATPNTEGIHADG